MNTFEVYHSPEYYSFTMIEKKKEANQKHLLEDDAVLIDTFEFNTSDAPNRSDAEIDKEANEIKVLFNKCIKSFMDKEAKEKVSKKKK